ncbi:hypothetical protein CHUAL_008172 [Chamberlinius hualienensis]
MDSLLTDIEFLINVSRQYMNERMSRIVQHLQELVENGNEIQKFQEKNGSEFAALLGHIDYGIDLTSLELKNVSERLSEIEKHMVEFHKEIQNYSGGNSLLYQIKSYFDRFIKWCLHFRDQWTGAETINQQEQVANDEQSNAVRLFDQLCNEWKMYRNRWTDFKYQLETIIRSLESDNIPIKSPLIKCFES